MGHIISEKGMSTDPQKVEAITRLPSPANIKDARRVLGMVQYLSSYIPNLTNIVQPLQNLLKKDVPSVWCVSQEKALRDMKQAIVQSPTLAIYDHQKELVLDVSYRVFNCILVHFIPLYLTLSFASFYSFTGIYILLILFLYSILSTPFLCTLYRRGWDYTAWSVFV